MEYLWKVPGLPQVRSDGCFCGSCDLIRQYGAAYLRSANLAMALECCAQAAAAMGGVIVMLHIYARCVLKRQARHREALHQLGRLSTTTAHVHTNEQPRKGLDAAVIATLPLFVYKGAEEIKDIHIECAVCLSNLEDEEMPRLRPNCKHTFHSQCIDTWLRVHSTCTICRTEAEPRAKPESIELAVVVPAMATAPPVDAINPTLPCSEGTSDGALGQSSKVGGSSSRLSSFRRILSREKSDRRLQPNEQTDCARDLERQ
ncbi:hypothetical protein IFM89_035904 [Coptis chinensis]|uniref:RING-type E3 ubiquitin transferase n=1 Tax=Coptis chinensis TaxID=261450 RepID=A0A835H0Z7_9MAGN|nr:hypothetical protein IFM89_035904 [Coptis chinensis]